MQHRSDAGKSGFLKDNAELIGVALRFMDFSIIIIGAMIAHFIRFDVVTLEPVYKLALVVTLFGVGAIFPLFGLYKPWRGKSVALEVRSITLAWATITILLPVLVYLSKTGADYSRLWFGYWVITSLVLLIISRLVIRELSKWARSRGFNTRNILIIGAGELGRRASMNLMENSWTGMCVIGYLDDDPDLQGKDVDGIPVLGTTDRLQELVEGPMSPGMSPAQANNQPLIDLKCLDQVWVALPITEQQKISKISQAMDDCAIPIVLVPDIFLHGLLNHSVDELAGMPVVNLRGSRIIGAASTLKMVEDFIISVAAITLTAPLMLGIAIGIKLGSPGPVLFKQRRYGIDGKEIIVWKFRTMTVTEDGPDVVQARRNDKRVTRLGAFLRKTSLDELPQFFNVLQGKMSVVGPRPHANAHNEQYRKIVEHYMWRCRVKPGITGWAQVNGWRGETDTREKMQKRVEFDLDYMRNWSIWMDLRIVVKTVIHGFVNKNAY